MKIFRKKENLRGNIALFKGEKKSIGFVPTMGSLHKGHLSLIKLAKEECDIVVCSIFINPTQFNDQKDYQLYPKHEKTDIKLLESEDCDFLYLPKVQDVYPNGIEKKTYPLDQLGDVLEGEYRPGHFNGVIEVVKRLLGIVEPDKAYFGMKDFQQLVVIRWMVKHFKIPVQIEGGPIIRDDSGIALSSRNERLSSDQFESALKLSKALFYIKNNVLKQSFKSLQSKLIEELEIDPNIKIEYLELAGSNDLQLLSEIDETQPTGIFIAAMIGEIRLIDNIILF